MTKYNITPFMPTWQLYKIVNKAQDGIELCSILSEMDSYMMQDLYSYTCTHRANVELAEHLWSLWKATRDAEGEQG